MTTPAPRPDRPVAGPRRGVEPPDPTDDPTDPPDAPVEVVRTPERADVTAAAAERLDDDAAAEALAEHVETVVRVETAREGLRRASRIADDAAAEAGVAVERRRPPLELAYPRWGWRRAIRFAVERRMLTPQYLRLYRRFLTTRARLALSRQHVDLQGLVFTGRRVEFVGRPGHGRLVVGPWCWIGDDNKLRAHEGQLTLGAKVVMGRDNVVNAYLDIEIGTASILADWIYVCDFDHRYASLDVPIKDQGIVKAPVRIGGDVWIGEKATVLKGVDVGHGSVVASHALVNRDVPPFSIAVGVPVRAVRSRLPEGMDPEEGYAYVRRGEPIPHDPLEA